MGLCTCKDGNCSAHYYRSRLGKTDSKTTKTKTKKKSNKESVTTVEDV